MVELITQSGRRLRLLDQAPIIGGEACVYRAVGPEGQDLAVKVALVPATEGSRLDRERALQRALTTSPELARHLVPLWDEGTWQGRPFLVRPWMPATLEQAARGADAPTRWRLAREAALAVAALHAADPPVLHRDLKPGNFLVDEAGRVRLADLGAARRHHREATTTLSALHSPAWAPPELALPGCATPCPTQDLYSLAATVFSVLVGHPPRAVAWNRSQVLAWGGPQGPARLVALTPGDRQALARGGAGPGLVERLEAMLAPDPGRRRGTAAELAHLLREPPGPRGPGLGLVLAGAVLAAALLLLAWPPPPAPLYPSVQVRPGGEGGAVDLVEGPGLGSPLRVGRTEVTQGQWRRLMGTDAVRSRRLTEAGGLGAPCDRFRSVPLAGDTLPVICVGWWDAVRFANALSAAEGLAPAYLLQAEAGAAAPTVEWDRASPGWRLPTSAEWSAIAGELSEDRVGALPTRELCARGNLADRALGRVVPELRHLETCDDGVAGLAPVGTYLAGPPGVYDLVGNVAEWVWDAHPQGGRMARGFAWTGVPEPFTPGTGRGLPDQERYLSVGFRLVRDLR